MKIHFIHGVHTSTTNSDMGKLENVFQSFGFDTVLHKYGFLWFFLAALY